MNAARLARSWQEAQGDPVLMAEALSREIDDPATGLVSRDHLRAEIAGLENRLVWRFLGLLATLFGVQVALVGLLVGVLLR